MAGRKKSRVAREELETVQVSAQEKIARVLGLLLVKDLRSKNEQVPLLRTAGFSVPEVATMLGIGEGHVRQADYESRKKRKRA